MKRIKIIFLISIFMALPCLAEAQELMPANKCQKDSTLTLDQCISMALENNRKAETAKNEVEMAVNLKREAFTKYFPEIAAMGMAFWANHDILQYNILDIIELGIIKKGKVAGVQALQPIFTGGLIINGNKLAGVGEEVARLRKQQTDNELRLTTETLFWKLNTLKSTMKVLDTAVSFLDTLENQVKAAVDAGVVTRNDLLKVQLKRNGYMAEKVDLENGISLMKMLLAQYVGLGVTDKIEIVAEMPDNVPPFPYDIYSPTENALPLTADYQLLERNVEAKKLEKRMEIGSNLPSVAFGAGWYYHDLLEQNHNFGALQLAVNIPLSGWWSGAYGIKRKDLALKNARNELEELSEELRIDMQDKWNTLTAAHRKMEIEKIGIEQSEENLYLNRMYYEAGMCTMSDLLEAETSRKEADDRFVSAYGNFCTAKAAYMIATGR
ncbi:MAG: TolC family protein [Muribaculaceae bacterium]|nr:TolC family protein [Muribaculaceae bacterium]